MIEQPSRKPAFFACWRCHAGSLRIWRHAAHLAGGAGSCGAGVVCADYAWRRRNVARNIASPGAHCSLLTVTIFMEPELATLPQLPRLSRTEPIDHTRPTTSSRVSSVLQSAGGAAGRLVVDTRIFQRGQELIDHANSPEFCRSRRGGLVRTTRRGTDPAGHPAVVAAARAKWGYR